PDFYEALEQQIGPAAEIALHRAGRNSDDRRYDRQQQTEQDRDPKAVDHACDDVATLIVRAKPIVFKIAAAGELLLLHHRLALRFGKQPGRLRRRRRGQIEVMSTVGEPDRRPYHVAAFVGDELLQEWVTVVRGRLEVATERGFRIVY